MMENTNKQVVPLYEIAALRQDNCRVYQMSDGSQRAEYTPVPVAAETGVAACAVAEAEAGEGQAACTLATYSWSEADSAYKEAVSHTVMNDMPLYIQVTLPTLPRSPHIKKAELVIKQADYYYSVAGNNHKLALYAHEGAVGVAVSATAQMLDYVPVTGPDEGETIVPYRFDVTALLDQAVTSGTDTFNLAVNPLDDTGTWFVTLYGSEAIADPPALHITYESSYGIHTGYRTHTHELGRLGQGHVDLQCRNLMLDVEDFAWGGNRMPVTIRHQYNSALGKVMYTGNDSIQLHAADFSAMKLGYGWKLNVMQSMVAATFVHEGAACGGYIYNDENGADVYFKPSEKTATDAEGTAYALYEDVDGGDTVYDPVNRTLTMGNEVYTFDEAGRLVRIADEYGNAMTMTYENGKLTAITDGADRRFVFGYDEATGTYVERIVAPDGTAIQYVYSGGFLNTITYPDGTKARIFYGNAASGNCISKIYLYEPNGVPVYGRIYHATNGRLDSLEEQIRQNGQFVTASTTAFAYSAAANRATVTTTVPADSAEGETADVVTATVYTFDDEGNVVGEYMDVDGVNMGLTGETGTDKGIGARRYSENLLKNHDFQENAVSIDGGWSVQDTGSLTCLTNYGNAKHGNYCLYLQREQAGSSVLSQNVGELQPGDYTFSAYVRTLDEGIDGGIVLGVQSGTATLGQSDGIMKTPAGEYERLTASFHLTVEADVTVKIAFGGIGKVLVDSAQLEKNGYAGAYNLLHNGSFERVSGEWTMPTTHESITQADHFNGNRSLEVIGALDEAHGASQTVDVIATSSTRETFTLSGWAKALGLPTSTDADKPAATFRLRAEIRLVGVEEPEVYTADFAPCTTGWQYASVQFAKAQFATVESLKVYCDYDYNNGVAYFDDIQLVRDAIETDLTEADFTGADIETADQPTALADSAAADTAPEFAEAVDAFGNAITETTFTEGEFGTVYRSFGYDEDGNNLVRETDARGNETVYTVDPLTSRNTAVTDRCGNQTAYEYDASGRTTKVTSKNGAGAELANVRYAYNALSNLTAITRGDGMKYALAYTPFHQLQSIGITGKTEPLVSYAYKNGNGRLKSVTYANGDTMKATYNGLGQVVAEKWYDGSNVLIAHYKYVYDGEGNIVRSIDILALKEYTYTYEEGRLVLAAEYALTLDGYENITHKELVNTIRYRYDKDGNLTRQDVSVTGQTVCYEYPENGNPVVKFGTGDNAVTSHSKTDSFGRKVFEELQLGKGFVSRQFMYHAGEITDEHQAHGKVKSSAVCHLVSQIVLSDERTLTYEYDEEERITRVIDSADGEWVYTYDALGQLLTEKHKAVGAEEYTVVNAMTYDNYGNILTKNGVTYTYDSTWRDLLTSYNGQTITYDAQGNPTTYLGCTMEWEKGRQLKKLTKPDGTVITYTYNANGIRTGKVVNGAYTDYILDGTKILYEGRTRNLTGDGHANVLIPIYDNEDAVCGIFYNGAPYYFLKNLQGDVVAITDYTGEVVCRYTYDAWGKVTGITGSLTLIGIENPYRYRSYYYDTETGLYYLQSRYYDPETGRFINADDVRYLNGFKNIIGLNAITYCVNSPIGYYDPFGKWVLSVGVEGQAAYVLGVYAGFAINIDGKWNVSITYTIGFAIIINIAASIKAYVAYYIGKSNVSQITGWGISVGVSFSAGIHLSGGGAFDVGFTGNPGGSVNIGYGKGVAVAPVPYFETKIGYTGKLWQFNLLTLLKTWHNNVKKSLWFLTLNVVVTKRNGYVEIYLKPLKKTLYIYKGGKIKVR